MKPHGYKLKLCSKKLHSGRCQIKFYVTPPEEQDSFYGYLLAEPGSTLREVVEEIEHHVRKRTSHLQHHHEHLFNLGRRKYPSNHLLFFSSHS